MADEGAIIAWLRRLFDRLGGGLPAALSTSGRLKVELGTNPTIDIGVVDQGSPNAGGALPANRFATRRVTVEPKRTQQEVENQISLEMANSMIRNLTQSLAAKLLEVEQLKEQLQQGKPVQAEG